MGLIACNKEDDTELFYWDETGCSDPWLQNSEDTEKQTKDLIRKFLLKGNVNVEEIRFEFDQTKMQNCRACHCKTGRIIIVEVASTDKNKMKELEFYQ